MSKSHLLLDQVTSAVLEWSLSRAGARPRSAAPDNDKLLIELAEGLFHLSKSSHATELEKKNLFHSGAMIYCHCASLDQAKALLERLKQEWHIHSHDERLSIMYAFFRHPGLADEALLWLLGVEDLDKHDLHHKWDMLTASLTAPGRLLGSDTKDEIARAIAAKKGVYRSKKAAKEAERAADHWLNRRPLPSGWEVVEVPLVTSPRRQSRATQRQEG